MPARLGSAIFSLETDSSKFNAGMDAAEQKTGGLSRAIGGVSATTRIMTGVMAGSAAGAMSQWAQAAADDEANTLKLKQAVDNTGVSFAENEARINERIKAGQNLAFTDDQVRDSLSMLVAQTGSLDEALERQKLAMDLSRGANIDLQTASKLLGKVTDENVAVLGRYGINVAKGSDATALFGAVQQKFGGQAETYGNTTSAAIFKTKDAISEWQESIGAALGPAGQYIALLPGLTAGMQLAGGAMGAAMPKILALTASMWSMIPAVLAAAIPFWPIIAVVAAVGAAVLALKWAWENNLGDIQGKAEAFIGFLSGWATGFVEIGSSIVSGIWAGVSGAWGWVMAQIQGLVNRIPEGVRKLLGISSPSTVFMEIGQNIMLGLAQGITENTPKALGAMHDAMATLRGISGVAGENINRGLGAVTAAGGAIRGFQGGGTANIGDAIVMPGGTVVYATPGLTSVGSGGQTMQIAVNIDGRKVAQALAIPQARDARLAGAS